jgi:hypothetical protein
VNANSVRMRPRARARSHNMRDFTSDAPSLHELYRAATSREGNNALASPSRNCCGHLLSEDRPTWLRYVCSVFAHSARGLCVAFVYRDVAFHSSIAQYSLSMINVYP